MDNFASDTCIHCGEPLESSQKFCPKCGQKAGSIVDATVATTINQANTASTKNKKRLLTITGLVAVAVIIIIVIALSVGGAQVVADGALIERADFNSYKSGEVYEDIDTKEPIDMDGEMVSGVISIFEHEKDITTARNIKIGDSVEKMERAYDGNVFSKEDKSAISERFGDNLFGREVIYTYKLGEYELEFITEDEKITHISMSNAAYRAWSDKYIQERLSELQSE
jgi:hypothetical protein